MKPADMLAAVEAQEKATRGNWIIQSRYRRIRSIGPLVANLDGNGSPCIDVPISSATFIAAARSIPLRLLMELWEAANSLKRAVTHEQVLAANHSFWLAHKALEAHDDHA